MASTPRIRTKKPGVYYRIEKDGRKQFYIRYRDINRKEIEECVGSGPRMTAVRAAVERSSRISGLNSSNSESRKAVELERSAIKWTISKLWFEYSKTRGSDPSKPYKSKDVDEDRFNKHFVDLANLLPPQIDHLRYERWKRKVSEGRSPTTVYHCAELLRRIIRFGTERNLIEGLPFKLTLSKPDNKTTEYLDNAQLCQLMQALDTEEPIIGNMFRLVLLTGLRRGELMKLSWSDFDPERKTLLLRDTKAGKDQLLPISEDAIQLLLDQPRHPNNSALVFPSPQGCQWSKSSLDRVFKRISSRADLPPGFRLLHGLRHQYGSKLAEAGATIVEIRDLMRHSDVQVSERYLHTTKDHLLKMANRLAANLKHETSHIQLHKTCDRQESYGT
jgi:integrase